MSISFRVRGSIIRPVQIHTGIHRILVLVLLMLPFRAQNALGQIVGMAVVTPKELTAGTARGQTVRGRVRMFALEKKGKVDCAECHVVVEPGFVWCVVH